jgi:hypothetical protein
LGKKEDATRRITFAGPVFAFKGGADMSTTEQFFPALMAQKVPTLRWCLVYNGCDPFVTQDASGHSAMENAAAMGKDKSLRVILEVMEVR